jgi:cytochrome c oxidase subunit 1
MVGSMLMALLAGLYYWWPKMFGRMYHENTGRIAFLIIFIGFNLTFFPQFVMGSRGMPRRYASYPIHFVSEHRASTAGAYTMGVGLIIVAFNLLHAIKRGKPAAANPWGSNTLEWRTPSPPPHDNFKETPVAGDPYDLHGWKQVPGKDEWVLDKAEHQTIDGPANDPAARKH